MRKILRDIYLRLAGSIKQAKPGIHIINSHFVTPYELDVERDTHIFDNLLKYLQQFSRFITLQDATERILSNNIPEDEVLIAFTFDDGFEECYSVIAPVLEKYNTRGGFFINSNYIESDEDYQIDFQGRINTFTKKPMNWNQVIDIHNRGHLIGAHTLDHVNLAELNDSQMELQLTENKKILESKLNYNCDYFAWTYGQLVHFPESALKATLKHHKYIFSGTNYKNYFSYDGQVINRRHMEAFWPKSHLNYFLAVNKKWCNKFLK